MSNTMNSLLQLIGLGVAVSAYFYYKRQLKLSARRLLNEWLADERIKKLLQHSRVHDLCYSEGTVYLFIPQALQVKLLSEYLGLTIRQLNSKRMYAMAIVLYYQQQKNESIESEYHQFKRSIENSDHQ